jgi:hypothetical protein
MVKKVPSLPLPGIEPWLSTLAGTDEMRNIKYRCKSLPHLAFKHNS